MMPAAIIPLIKQTEAPGIQILTMHSIFVIALPA